MVNSDVVHNLEKVLMKEATSVAKLHERIQLLESELNEMKQLKSAYSSDTKALNAKIKTL